MAIPNGTRFIGISQEVDLTERKSDYLNSLTEPYTFPDDFNLSSSSYLSYAGTMTNFGGNQLSALGGYTADFGTVKSLGQVGFIIVSQDCKVASLGWQWCANIQIFTAAGTNKSIGFKISTATVGGNMNNPSLWTDYYITTIIDTDTAPYPGFVEDVSALNIELPAGSVVAVTAISSAPFDNSTSLEANVSITLESV